MTSVLVPRDGKVPCMVCSGDGFVQHEDRLVETVKESCRACGGLGYVAPRTGQTRESSFDPETGRPFGEAERRHTRALQ